MFSGQIVLTFLGWLFTNNTARYCLQDIGLIHMVALDLNLLDPTQVRLFPYGMTATPPFLTIPFFPDKLAVDRGC